MIDCPAGIDTARTPSSPRTRPSSPCRKFPRCDADRIIGLFANEVSYVKLIINRLRKDMIDAGNMLDIDDTLEILRGPFGHRSRRFDIIRSSNIGDPVVIKAESLAGIAYRNTLPILGEDVPLMELKRPAGFSPH